MKALLKSSAFGAALALACVAPALADVQVIGTVTKEKTVDITITTDKTKLVDINVLAVGTFESAAQASAFVNASIDNNTSTYAQGHTIQDDVLPPETFEGDSLDADIQRDARIAGSVLDNLGIVQLNQDNGVGSNQGNVVSAALVFGDTELVAEAEAYASQRVTNSFIRHTEGSENVQGLLTPDDPSDDQPADMTATITDSINNNAGVVQVNQNSGTFNNQHNALALATGDNAFVALSDAGLGQEVSGNVDIDFNTLKTETIRNSANGNAGIVSVNQSVGQFNNQATIVSIASISSAVGLGQ